MSALDKPAPIDYARQRDVAAALDHLIEAHGAENVAVAGDSAGAALVLSAVMARLTVGKAVPKRLACLSALTDMAWPPVARICRTTSSAASELAV